MADWLRHPLVLVLIGAAISGLAIPYIARRWQDRRKALEIKTDLVERVARAVTEIATATQFVIVGAKSQSQEDFDQAYRSWLLDKAVLTSVLGAYYRSGIVHDSWITCRGLATAYYVHVGIRRANPIASESARSRYLSAVAEGLSRNPPLDVSENPDAFEEPASPSVVTLNLSDSTKLRAELDRAVSKCVAAITDERVLLAR